MHQETEPIISIKFVRMNTGEDLITEFSDAENDICFVNPLKVIYGLTPKQDGMIISLMHLDVLEF